MTISNPSPTRISSLAPSVRRQVGATGATVSDEKKEDFVLITHPISDVWIFLINLKNFFINLCVDAVFMPACFWHCDQPFVDDPVTNNDFDFVYWQAIRRVWSWRMRWFRWCDPTLGSVWNVKPVWSVWTRTTRYIAFTVCSQISLCLLTNYFQSAPKILSVCSLNILSTHKLFSLCSLNNLSALSAHEIFPVFFQTVLSAPELFCRLPNYSLCSQTIFSAPELSPV